MTELVVEVIELVDAVLSDEVLSVVVGGADVLPLSVSDALDLIVVLEMVVLVVPRSDEEEVVVRDNSEEEVVGGGRGSEVVGGGDGGGSEVADSAAPPSEGVISVFQTSWPAGVEISGSLILFGRRSAFDPLAISYTDPQQGTRRPGGGRTKI